MIIYFCRSALNYTPFNERVERRSKKISTDYNAAISALSDAKTAFDKKSWWDKNQHRLAPIILVTGISVIALGAFKSLVEIL